MGVSRPPGDNMVRRGSERWAAENAQGRGDLPPDAYKKWPESTGETAEMLEDIAGVTCRDPETDKKVDRVWVGWDNGVGKGEPVIYIRVHDLGFRKLRELARTGAEPHKQGNYLWKHTGPWEIWDHFDDWQDGNHKVP